MRETRHPGLESHPRHDLWKRDFSGACGLFSIYLDPAIPVEAVDAMADNLSLYGIGASWGGHESLIMEAEFTRSVTPKTDARVLRFYAGLEDPDDLLDDLKAGSGACDNKLINPLLQDRCRPCRSRQ